MSLLKQNGVNGKIIRAQGSGKVLKQNYNFGDFLNNNYNTGYFYLQFQHSALIHTFMIWAEAKVGMPDNKTNTIIGSPIFAVRKQAVRNYPDFYANGGVWCYQDPIKGTYSADRRGLYMHSPTTHKVDAYYKAYKTTAPVDPLKLSVAQYSKIPRVVFFDREILSTEMIYYYNNNLGNDLLNQEGLISDFNFTKGECEVVTVDSVEYAGFKDSISGMHCYFTNLPAGTPQEQVDFVNNNLFY